jgi:hypothetical protein
MHQMKKRTSRLTSQHRLEIVRRRCRVAELISEGKTTRDCEQVLRAEGFQHCDHTSVVRDLKLERDRLAQAARATTLQHRQKVLEKLTQMEAFVRARGWDDPNYLSDLLGIIDRTMRLMGLAEQHHHVVVATTEDIPVEKLVGWKRWLRETEFIPEDSFDAVWAVCRKLSQPPSFESAMLIGPPADSPLWHDDDEDEGKSN